MSSITAEIFSYTKTKVQKCSLIKGMLKVKTSTKKIQSSDDPPDYPLRKEGAKVENFCEHKNRNLTPSF